jgi:hypothetical protein
MCCSSVVISGLTKPWLDPLATPWKNGEEHLEHLIRNVTKARPRGKTPGALLAELASLRLSFSSCAAVRKRALFEALADVPLPSAKDVLKLHELLVFARAYPDDEGVLATVETVLAAFESRRDLRRHRRELANSGIAGTEIRYKFFYPTAVALARRFPGRLRIDWRAWERKRDLVPYLALLVPYAETPALDEWEREPREWIDFLRSEGEPDGVFLALRFTAMDASSFVREVIYDNLSPAMILEPGPGMPTRTHAKAPVAQVVFQRAPLDASRADLVKATRSWRVRVREVTRREASLYVRMVSDAMVTRSRDLDAFSYASVDDVRLCDLDDGFTLAVLGVVPERRLLLESMHGALTMKNGVPIGYVLFSSLFESTEVAFNVFDTFRGARTFSRACWPWVIGYSARGHSRSIRTSSGTSETTKGWRRVRGGSTTNSDFALAIAASCVWRRLSFERWIKTVNIVLAWRRSRISRWRRCFSRSVARTAFRRERFRPAAPASRSRAVLPGVTARHASAELQSRRARRRRFAAFGRSPDGA